MCGASCRRRYRHRPSLRVFLRFECLSFARVGVGARGSESGQQVTSPWQIRVKVLFSVCRPCTVPRPSSAPPRVSRHVADGGNEFDYEGVFEPMPVGPIPESVALLLFGRAGVGCVGRGRGGGRLPLTFNTAPRDDWVTTGFRWDLPPLGPVVTPR